MKTVAFAALVFCLAGCSRETPTPLPVGGEVKQVELPGNHPPLTTLPDPEANGGHAGRAPRRISVPQLKQSIITTTGREWAKLDDLASSLGKADYAITVSDSTEANLVFAKFLDDGAREVCKATATEDLLKPQGERVLSAEIPDGVGIPSDELLQRNLQSLALRFWGSSLDEAELSTWLNTFKTKLYPAADASASKRWQAWGSVCVAMMTDQRFITY